MSEYVLELKGITKIFPGVKALNNVQFQLKSGEVHALMGENGAGKSNRPDSSSSSELPRSESYLRTYNSWYRCSC